MSESLNQRIWRLLQQRNMSQKELAERAEITEAAVSHYLKGDRVPRATVLARIAAALDTTADYLMEGTPQNKEGELGYAKKLIARNVHTMTADEKMEIMRILIKNDT